MNTIEQFSILLALKASCSRLLSGMIILLWHYLKIYCDSLIKFVKYTFGASCSLGHCKICVLMIFSVIINIVVLVYDILTNVGKYDEGHCTTFFSIELTNKNTRYASHFVGEAVGVYQLSRFCDICFQCLMPVCQNKKF